MDEKQEFKHYLRQRRISAGLSQADVSRALGYRHSQFISNWERGLAYPPMKALPVLSKLYGIPMEQLYQALEGTVLRNVEASLREEYARLRRMR